MLSPQPFLWRWFQILPRKKMDPRQLDGDASPVLVVLRIDPGLVDVVDDDGVGLETCEEVVCLKAQGSFNR